MQQHIHCSVDNCHYWTSGNKCAASEILVTSDSFAQKAPDTIDAPKATTLDTTPANSCMETCCKLLSPKVQTSRMRMV